MRAGESYPKPSSLPHGNPEPHPVFLRFMGGRRSCGHLCSSASVSAVSAPYGINLDRRLIFCLKFCKTAPLVQVIMLKTWGSGEAVMPHGPPRVKYLCLSPAPQHRRQRRECPACASLASLTVLSPRSPFRVAQEPRELLLFFRALQS